MKKPKVIAVVGATASGKTSLSIDIATQFGGEIISCDSRQVYKKLDIGTAKVTREEMQNVPHHLIDVVEVTDTYTAADFTRDASQAIEEIVARNNIPIIAGGTFFYLDQLRGRGSVPNVEPNEELRAKLDERSAAELYQDLQKIDKRRAKTIDPHNKRRLIRALEIVDALGKVPATPAIDSAYDWLVLGIEQDKTSLQARYQRRATTWLQTGILEETKWLKEQVSIDRFGEFGFEYILADQVLSGELAIEEFTERFVQKNWQYAKRQRTWLKRDADIKWYRPEDLTEISERVQDFLSE